VPARHDCGLDDGAAAGLKLEASDVSLVMEREGLLT